MSARVIPDRDQLVEQAVQMRLSGAPYRLIGQALDVSPMTALAWTREHIHDGGPHAERLRAMELGRLDRQLEHLAERRAALASTPGGTP